MPSSPEECTEAPNWKVSSYHVGDGHAKLDASKRQGLEGVVAKRMGSRYASGRRTPDWRKIKLISTQDCVILGWTPGQGGRSTSFGGRAPGAFRCAA